MTSPVTYDSAFQAKLVALSLRDTAFMNRVDGLIKPDYFEADTHKYLADFAARHFEKYHSTPDLAILAKHLKDAKASKAIKSDFVDDLKPIIKHIWSPTVDLSNRDFYVEQVSHFARQRALEDAISKSIDILDAGGNLDDIDKMIKEAQSVGAHEGTSSRNLFEATEDAINARLAKLSGVVTRGISTGHRELDEVLYHKGWGKKEMYILMGGAKAGKSTGLGHFAINAVRQGYKVLYTTHENSADVTIDRMHAAIAGIQMKELDTHASTIKVAVDALAARGGLLIIEEFPAGEASVADIKRVIDKYKAQGVIFDMLVCDYADELRASRRHTDERFALKEVYTAFRALCQTENLAGLTATQTNRAGNKATTAVATDVGEDWSKMKIADGVITINANDDEKRTGQLRLYFALMRNNEAGMTFHCLTDRSRMQFITRITKIS